MKKGDDEIDREARLLIAHHGRTLLEKSWDESLNRCDELSPGFVGSRRDWRPYADDAKNEKLREALRLAAG
jgi:hypothetical protein